LIYKTIRHNVETFAKATTVNYYHYWKKDVYVYTNYVVSFMFQSSVYMLIYLSGP